MWRKLCISGRKSAIYVYNKENAIISNYIPLLLYYWHMIIFLYGKDTYSSRRQLQKMKEKFKIDRDPQGLNCVVCNCLTIEPKDMLSQIQSSPFLAEKRMVILENCISSAHENLRKHLVEVIMEEKVPKTTVLVFWENTDTFKKKEQKTLFSLLQSQQYAQCFDMLKESQRIPWIQASVADTGDTISSHAAAYLAANIGSDTWRLASVIAQLSAHNIQVKNKEDGVLSIKKQEIGLADVKKFVEAKEDDSIFTLVDAIIAKNAKRVFSLVAEQYSTGKDVQYIFAMVLRQCRILLEMRDLFEREDVMQSAILAKKLGIHPFVAKKSLPFVKKYTTSALKTLYNELLKLDVNIKTGQGNSKVLFDILLGRWCANTT
ncbi:MAG: DNA polymerase III subunit delta [Candidatus Magasanikbacteria bacterium]|nr:DNA polymerase III subunit delta [Candidatus Magasanikbacteria bacterium]